MVMLATWIAYNDDVDGNLDLFHAGERLAHYDALTAGKLPFRDIFVQHGFGENIVKPWLACRRLGPSVESLRRIGENAFIPRGVLPPLGVAAVLLAAASLARRAWIVAVLAIALSTTWCEATDRHALGFLSLACTGRFITTRRRGWLIASGVTAGLAALYSLDVGVYVLAATALWIVLDALMRRSRRIAATRVIGAFACGVGIALLPFLAWCLYEGIAADLGRNVYVQLFMRSEVLPMAYPRPTWNATLPFIDGALGFAETSLLFVLLPLSVAGLASITLIAIARRARVRAGRRSDARATAAVRPGGDNANRPRPKHPLTRGALTPPGPSRLALAVACALCFWAGVVGRPDAWHVAYAMPALLLAAGVAWDNIGRIASSRRLRITLGAWLMLLLAGLAWLGDGGTIGRRWLGRESRYLPSYLQRAGRELAACALPRVGRVHIEPRQAGYVAGLVKHIQRLTPPDGEFLDLTNQSLLYFLAQRGCPTRFYSLAHAGASPRLQAQLLEELRARPRPPACVVRFTAPIGDAGAIRAFIDERYECDAVIGPIEVMRRRTITPKS
ncbi:MAG: hypothetical protein L6R00_05000 [Phycisphaerae bacterium]|nr:hypothetical protein [Phycisphaerae bacterium]